MTALYALYDALVSISVPSEKARAVVDALEHDMFTALTTKTDLAATHLLMQKDTDALRAEFGTLRASLRAEFDAMRETTAAEFASVRKEIAAQGTSTTAEFASVRMEVANLRESTAAEFSSVRTEIANLRDSTAAEFAKVRMELIHLRDTLRQEIKIASQSAIIWLGSIQIASAGLLFTALELT